jgi:hypothetical protein
MALELAVADSAPSVSIKAVSDAISDAADCTKEMFSGERAIPWSDLSTTSAIRRSNSLRVARSTPSRPTTPLASLLRVPCWSTQRTCDIAIRWTVQHLVESVQQARMQAFRSQPVSKMTDCTLSKAWPRYHSSSTHQVATITLYAVFDEGSALASRFIAAGAMQTLLLRACSCQDVCERQMAKHHRWGNDWCSGWLDYEQHANGD